MVSRKVCRGETAALCAAGVIRILTKSWRPASTPAFNSMCARERECSKKKTCAAHTFCIEALAPLSHTRLSAAPDELHQ